MITYRPAQLEDYRSIAHLHTRSWQENYRGNFSDRFLDEEALADRMRVWEERLTRPAPNQFLWVATQNGEICGFACAFKEEDSQYGTLLDNLHVSKASIGQGIGKRLISLLANEIKQTLPNAKMYLWVLENNVSAIRFYERLGGVNYETVVGNDIGDREIRKCRMVWNSLESLEMKDHPLI
ncbi:GNAT family N-acetyltransferase [Arenibacter lacus]|uniref:GNAT family N-acetyltransferase n=1 Tax=Arenibacter lacus TaxID=2608629 RepID=UPI00123D5758|nr:GNAT family N-acetyltransferase [Arenibacter lacus]